MHDLAPHEEKVLSLVESGKTFDEIDQALGTKHSRQVYRNALGKIDKDELLKRFPLVAISQDDKGLEALEQEVLQAAQQAGLPHGILKQVQKRISAKHGELTRKVKRLSDKETIGLMEERLYLAMDYLDDFALSGASAKDLAAVTDTLVSNIQLLKGRPTQIMSVERRQKIDALIPMLLIEAKRRGLTVLEGEFTRA